MSTTRANPPSSSFVSSVSAASENVFFKSNTEPPKENNEPAIGSGPSLA